MNSKRMKDLTRSSLTVIGVVSCLIAGIALLFPNHWQTLVLFASAPLGVFLFWGVHTYQLEPVSTQSQVRQKIGSVAPKRVEIIFGKGVYDNPLAPIPNPRSDRRVLGIKTKQQQRHAARERILTGREPIIPNKVNIDQWHD